MSEVPGTRAGSAKRAVEVRSEELLRRARGGDRDAFDALAVRLVPALLGSARRLLRDPADAEDAVAESLWKAWRRLAKFRGEATLSTWVHRILLCTALDRHRARAREARHRDLAARRPARPEPPAPIVRMAQEEEIQALRIAVEALPEIQRLMVILTAWEGLRLAEAARLLSLRYATAKSNLHHARIALRRALVGEGDR